MTSVERTFRTYTVEDVEPVGDEAIRISLRAPNGTGGLPGAPGQHVTLRTVDPVHGELRRSYSVCAGNDQVISIGVRKIPTGRMSTLLHERTRPGDHLDVMAPTGSFTLVDEPGHHGFIAAGSGITPVLAMIRACLAGDDTAATLIYVNRTSGSAMFLDDLHAIKNIAPHRLQLLFVTTREQRGAPWCSRRLDRDDLTELIENGAIARARHWYACGPDPFIDRCVAGLTASGVPAASVRRESFGVPTTSVAAPDHDAVEATLAFTFRGRTSMAAVQTGRTLLDAAATVRRDVPYSCRTGSCSTCRARLVAGEAHMADSPGLTAAERSAGYLLTCRSTPRTGDVAVDFDI